MFFYRGFFISFIALYISFFWASLLTIWGFNAFVPFPFLVYYRRNSFFPFYDI